MGFRALVEGVHDNLLVIPEYQRKYRWSKVQVEDLATSLIRQFPIPPIYTYRNGKGQLEILDGQQRVMSLYFYYIGKFFKNDLFIDKIKNYPPEKVLRICEKIYINYQLQHITKNCDFKPGAWQG